ncbi:hypothetical protein PPYR_06572 [Photinus pyralis]|uniref:C2H2-type domain-containing protein n=1 Tax=Photinus pyralis TaxID=7054 RepID=A0A5N4AU96_PHOPY|nr:hypothetical protein PPYR_06572 [Photinus pyralis]
MENLDCLICKKSINFHEYTNHLKFYHKYHENFKCAICFHFYTNIYALEKHLKRVHPNLPVRTETGPPVPLQDNVITPPNNVLNQHVEVELLIPSLPSLDQQHKLVHTFILSLYNSNITRKLIQEIIEYCSGMFSDFIDEIVNILKNILAPLNITCELNQIVSLLQNKNPFQNLTTEYKRLQFFEQMQYLVKSKSFLIGFRLDRSRNISFEYKKCEGEIVPLRHVLKLFLQLPNVFENINKFIKTEESMANENYYSSVFNGSLWAKLKETNRQKLVFPILLFFDDYESCNPLGTHAGVYKVGAVYVSIAGIPPKFSSLLENIFLFGLFHSNDRTIYGNQVIFKHFIQELSFLENEGINIAINNQHFQIYFSLILILGDNLGINSITGFSESFSSSYFCRNCCMSKEEAKDALIEVHEQRRNLENYREHSQNKSYGVKEACCWNVLPSYHCTINVSFDIMHDIFEGVCRYEIGFLLFYFIKTKSFFTLEQLNDRIKYFEYEDKIDCGNRFPLIKKNHIENKNLILSASEMFAFLTYFPCMIGDLIDVEDEGWHLFKLLYDIVYIITKRVTNDNEINYLKYIIKEHHEVYLNLTQQKLKPKHTA